MGAFDERHAISTGVGNGLGHEYIDRYGSLFFVGILRRQEEVCQCEKLLKGSKVAKLGVPVTAPFWIYLPVGDLSLAFCGNPKLFYSYICHGRSFLVVFLAF